jgi:hypothetical protein
LRILFPDRWLFVDAVLLYGEVDALGIALGDRQNGKVRQRDARVRSVLMEHWIVPVGDLTGHSQTSRGTGQLERLAQSWNVVDEGDPGPHERDERVGK